jgi:hypothetical protein
MFEEAFVRTGIPARHRFESPIRVHMQTGPCSGSLLKSARDG